jgi:hypothetical protein
MCADGRSLRQFVNRRSILLFISIGFLSAAYTSYVPFAQLTLKDMGLDPSLMGLMYAGASLLAAVGRYVHLLNRISFLRYALMDTAIGAVYVFVLGFVRSLPLLSS